VLKVAGTGLRNLFPNSAHTSETRSNPNPTRTAVRPRNHRQCIEFMWISAMREMTEVNGMFAARIGRGER
jgi:hypothetical protein